MLTADKSSEDTKFQQELKKGRPHRCSEELLSKFLSKLNATYRRIQNFNPFLSAERI
jgi:hypothetical protein